MKKFLSLILAVVVAVSMLSLFGCDSNSTPSDEGAVSDILAITQPKAVLGTVAITGLCLDADKGEAVLNVTSEIEKIDKSESLDFIYVFPDTPLTLGVFHRNSLCEDWQWVKDVEFTLGSGTETVIRIKVIDDNDMTQGFYMVKIKQ